MLDAACGAGKSFTLHRAITNLALKDADIIVVVPSKNLIKQYQADLALLSPALKVNVIHTDTMVEGQKPVRMILNYLRNEHKGEVLLITHQSFNIVCRIATGRKSRHLIIDEIPVPFSCLKYGDGEDEKEGLKRILECIEVVQSDTNPTFYAVEVKDDARLEKIAAERDENDDPTPLQVLAYQLLSTNYINVVNKKLWDSSKNERIDLYSSINYNIYKNYKSVTIAGACFTDTALYKLWNRNGVNFTVDEDLMKTLRYIKHQNGSEVKIYYSMADNTWSQNLMKDRYDSGKEITFGQNLKLIENAALKLFGDEHFIYNCNIVYKDLLFSGVETAHILPQTIHG